METRSNGDIGWAQIRVIELEKLLPVNALPISSTCTAFAHGIRVLFVHVDDELFTIHIKSDEGKKILDNDENDVFTVVPCMRLYTPDITLVGSSWFANF